EAHALGLDDERRHRGGARTRGKTQDQAQVEDRNDRAPQIRHADHLRRREWHDGVLVEAPRLPGPCDLDRERPAGDLEQTPEGDRGVVEGRGAHVVERPPFAVKRVTTVKSSSRVNGFVTYSSAPCRLPQIRSLSWSRQVTSTTGVWRVRSSFLRRRRIS